MPRTTYELVSSIIRLPDGADVSGFIRTANVIVTGRCGTLGYSTGELAEIETWLAAHLWSVDNSRKRDEKMGMSEETIVSKVDLGLNLTHHGQQVLILAYLGGFGDLDPDGSGKKQIKVLWLGKND